MSTSMTPERWSRIKALFAAAMEASPAERGGLIEREAAGDRDIADEVWSLLHAHELPGDLLESPPESVRVRALGNGLRAGERIGAYRLEDLIGSGGMGDVFAAVRDDQQYHAKVAIKLMRADVRNPLAEQRFRTERQILAQLDHRNIARLLDGGTTSNGLPYVVMELVLGEPIDRYCDLHRFGIRERVQIFLQVCAAVTYAHQHLVVHRDLKPNNILVTADGSVKLLDFGIAKLIETDPATGTVTEETVTQLRAMTLEYASPEQISGGTVTTVSDVYSLGVVLYRLLTGQSPYRATGGDAARMAEILGDTTPTRPSQVTRERPEIDTDLDNILLMALRKEPARRYPSVEQLAADLRNYLAGRAVAARRGSFGYLLGKFVRRHKVPIGAAALVVASLVGGLGLAIREAREAERQRAVAQRHFDSVRSLANRLIDFNDEIAKLENSTRAQETLVKTSLQYLDTLYQEAGEDPALTEELGIAYRKVADIQGSQMGANRGDPKSSLATYAKSNALLESILLQKPQDARLGAFLADSYMRQARTLLYTEGAKPALGVAERAVHLGETYRTGFESEGQYVGTLGDAYAIHAQTLGVLDRNDDAQVSLHKLIALSEEYTREHPDDELGLRGLAKAYINTAITDNPNEDAAQRLARAEPLFRKAMAVQERLILLDPARALYRWNLAETQYNLGDMLFDDGQNAAALELFRKASVVLATHDPDDARGVLINAMNDVDLAKALVKARHLSEAEVVLARVDPVLRKLLREGRTIQNEYFLGIVCLQRGYVQMERARQSRLTATERDSHWRQAHSALSEGVGLISNVNQTLELFGVEKQIWDEGLAALAQVETRLTAQ